MQPINRMPVVPVRLSNKVAGHSVNTYAVLDTAAEFNICSTELTEILRLDGKEIVTSVIGATGTAEESVAHMVKLSIRGYRSSEEYDISVYALPAMTNLKDHIPSQMDLKRYSHLRGLDIPHHDRQEVDLLIGIG